MANAARVKWKKWRRPRCGSSGVEPIMAEATVRRMDWSAQLGLKKLFGGEAPATHREFAEAVAELDKVRT